MDERSERTKQPSAQHFWQKFHLKQIVVFCIEIVSSFEKGFTKDFLQISITICDGCISSLPRSGIMIYKTFKFRYMEGRMCEYIKILF